MKTTLTIDCLTNEQDPMSCSFKNNIRMKQIGHVVYVIACCLFLEACNSHNTLEKTDGGEIAFSKTINLQIDSVLNSRVKDFFPIGNSGYILTDGLCIYKLDSTGYLTKQICDQGHGRNEYLKIGNLYSDDKYIYAWCESSFHLYKYDMDLNFLEKFQGPNRGIKKFVVSNNGTAYFLLSGGFDETIGALKLDHTSDISYSGIYSNEDKALLFNEKSGGITIFENTVRYVLPSAMNIYSVGNETVCSFVDDEFRVTTLSGDFASCSHAERLEYILSNSTCTGLYADGDTLWLITETGEFVYGPDGTLTTDRKRFNLIRLNERGDIVSSIAYNYPRVDKYLIRDGCLYFLSFDGDSYKIKQHDL